MLNTMRNILNSIQPLRGWALVMFNNHAFHARLLKFNPSGISITGGWLFHKTALHMELIIFQPFFTTKLTGQCTPLGLSMSYDIITKGHGGELEVENAPDKGAIFTFKLPIEISTNQKT